MILKENKSLLIYIDIDEADPVPYPKPEFLVGIFDVPDAEMIAEYAANMKIWEDKCWLDRFFFKKPKINVGDPKAVCKASAYLSDDGKVLVVRNVAAERGFGPTLYAVLMELARARGRDGVRPYTVPEGILERPKKIWFRFCNDIEYIGKVQTIEVDGVHSEPWLNRVYSLAHNASLFEYKDKRDKWKAYEEFWIGVNRHIGWRERAQEMATRSVEAHASGSHQ